MIDTLDRHSAGENSQSTLLTPRWQQNGARESHFKYMEESIAAKDVRRNE